MPDRAEQARITRVIAYGTPMRGACASMRPQRMAGMIRARRMYRELRMAQIKAFFDQMAAHRDAGQDSGPSIDGSYL